MDAPFDRGDVDRASLDATERLRARLSGKPLAPAAPPRRPVLPWIVAALLLVFTAGMIANPWFESSVRSRLPFARQATSAQPVDSAALQTRLQALEARAPAALAPPAPAAERLARTEAQIENSTDQIARDAARIDRLTADVAALQATIAAERARSETAITTASAAADRAQAMLTLVLVRRAIDSGRPTGPLDMVLRQSFEARYPQAVAQVLALGAAPATPATLRREFDALRPVLGGRPATGQGMGWWETLTTTIADAVSRPSSDGPADRAAAALARGDIESAASQLRSLPAPKPRNVNKWLETADRWLAGTNALATLETATLLTPAPANPISTAPSAAAVPTPLPSSQPAATPARKTSVAMHIGGIFPKLGLQLHLDRLF